MFPEQAQTQLLMEEQGTKRLLKTCWLQQEAGGVLRFRKASRGMAESRRAQAWGDGPSLPGHVHKVESQLVKEKFLFNNRKTLLLANTSQISRSELTNLSVFLCFGAIATLAAWALR